MSTPAERIHEMRLRAGLTLRDVAIHLGIQNSAVSKYERGIITNIPLDKIQQMADLFGTTPGYLSCWSDDPGPVRVSNDHLLSALVKKDPYISAIIEMMRDMPKKQKRQIVDIIRILSGSKE